MAREFERGPWGAGTLLYRVPDPERFGVAELDAPGNVVGFEEKPQQPKSDLIPIGVYFLRPDAFDVIDQLAPSGRGEFEITDVLNHYIPDRGLYAARLRGSLVRRRHGAVAARAGEDGRRGRRRGAPAAHLPARGSALERPARGDRPGACRLVTGETGDGRGRLLGPLSSDLGPPRATPQLPAAPRLLVTGGAGFIGSAFVRDVLARRDGTRIAVLDKLTYAGNRENLAPALADPEQAARLQFIQGDISDPDAVRPLVADADAVVNFAAESHVDRSILDPEAFLMTDVIGVHVLLEAVRRESAARQARPDQPAADQPAADQPAADQPRRPVRFLQVSTDEVYGTLGPDDEPWTESAPLAPRSPYAAAKAAGDLLVGSYVTTYGLDALITRGSNTYGPYQHPEKLIPLFISNALEDHPLPLYGDGMQRRDWLYVSDHAGAVEHVLRHGHSGEAYNVPGGAELPNREVVAALLAHLGKPWSLVRRVEDRPGHDRRYAMDGSKLHALGWRNRTSFETSLPRTIDWFVANEHWWRAIKSGEWDAYYRRQYERRLATSVEAER